MSEGGAIMIVKTQLPLDWKCGVPCKGLRGSAVQQRQSPMQEEVFVLGLLRRRPLPPPPSSSFHLPPSSPPPLLPSSAPLCALCHRHQVQLWPQGALPSHSATAAVIPHPLPPVEATQGPGLR